MNIAFTTFVLFILCLPGVIFRRTSSAAGRFRRPSPIAEELSKSVASATLAHAVWVPLCNLLAPRLGFGSVDLMAVARMATVQFGRFGDEFSDTMSSVTDYPYHVLGYFVSLNLAAWLAGLVCRFALTFRRTPRGMRKLVAHEPGALRYREWLDVVYYKDGEDMRTRGDVRARLSIVVEAGGVAHIYQGLLRKPFWSEDGQPDRFELNPVRRRLLTSEDVEDSYYYIESDSFVVRYSNIITLNVEYIAITRDEDEPDPPPPPAPPPPPPPERVDDAEPVVVV